MINIIDPHLHLFARSIGNYDWLNPEKPPFWPDKHVIARDFSTADISLQSPFNLHAFVHIEAGFDNKEPWREIQWLESLAEKQDRSTSMRSVANINLSLTDTLFTQQLNTLCEYTSVIGFRHILDEHASSLLQSTQVIRNLQKIAQADKLFECQLAATDTIAIELLNKLLNPQHEAGLHQLTIVINHAAFPDPLLTNTDYLLWQTNMQMLAANKSVYIKASGWEMVNRRYQASHIQRVVADLIHYFSEDKVLLASNFPLCLFSSAYQDLWQTYYDLSLSPEVKKKLMSRNAECLYNI